MSNMKKPTTSWRGEAMLRIAAIYAEMDRLNRAEMSAEKFDARTKEFRKQLAELQAKMLT